MRCSYGTTSETRKESHAAPARIEFPTTTNEPSVTIPAAIDMVNFPVILRGRDMTGERFELQGRLDKMSGHGLSLRIPRPLPAGGTVLACVRFSLAPTHASGGTSVAMRGTVQRSDSLGGDYLRVVIAFERHHFLYR
jgi:hypothetical protein